MPKIEKVPTTHIRIENELKARLDALATGNESARDVIRRLLNWYESSEAGIPVKQQEEAPVTLADIRQIIREEIGALTPVNRVGIAYSPAALTGVTGDGQTVNSLLTDTGAHRPIRKQEDAPARTEVSFFADDESTDPWTPSDDIEGMIPLKVAISEYAGEDIPSVGPSKQKYEKIAQKIRRACSAGKITKGPQKGRDSFINAEEFRAWAALNPYNE